MNACQRLWVAPFGLWFLVAFGLMGLATSAPAGRTLHLVSLRDHIEGSFVGPRAVYADDERIYLASYQGTLFVLARNRAANFPVVEIIQNSGIPLVAVRGDSKRLFVVDQNGVLRVYEKDHPLRLIRTSPVSTYVSAMDLTTENLYFATGGGQLAVDREHVYVSVPDISENHRVVEFDKRTLQPGLTYDASIAPNATVVFDRLTGARYANLPNPVDLIGRVSLPNLYVDQRVFVQTIPGCCGPGMFMYDSNSVAFERLIDRSSVNTVERRGRWLIAGNEGGHVELFDLGVDPPALAAVADLRALTGFTGAEDIEIRALWMDGHDNLVFAGSSWGNDRSRSPLLPSFFVLELTKN